MLEYELIILGEPAPWCVYTRRGPPSRSFEAMQAWQEQIRGAIIHEYGRPMLACPVELDAVFYRRVPKPWPKNQDAMQRRIREALTRRPDLTNYLKALEDALVGVLIQDDAQVIRTTMSKKIAWPGEEPGAHLVVTVVE